MNNCVSDSRRFTHKKCIWKPGTRKIIFQDIFDEILGTGSHCFKICPEIEGTNDDCLTVFGDNLDMVKIDDQIMNQEFTTVMKKGQSEN